MLEQVDIPTVVFEYLLDLGQAQVTFNVKFQHLQIFLNVICELSEEVMLDGGFVLVNLYLHQFIEGVLDKVI